MSTNETKLVTLACNGYWQPVLPAFQYEDNTGNFKAIRCTFIVRTDTGIEFGGYQYQDKAQKFARSFGRGCEVVEVAPYWYVPGFGKVD